MICSKILAGFIEDFYEAQNFGKTYEPVIRRAAGLENYQWRLILRCTDKDISEFLIVGSGISGLLSALLLAETGETLLIEEDFILGGRSIQKVTNKWRKSPAQVIKQ